MLTFAPNHVQFCFSYSVVGGHCGSGGNQRGVWGTPVFPSGNILSRNLLLNFHFFKNYALFGYTKSKLKEM